MTSTNPFARRLAAFALALIVGFGASLALAETEEELLAKRTLWQDRYRVALTNRVILTDNVERLLHDYAQAQRVRQRFHDRFLDIFQACDVVLTPSTGCTANFDGIGRIQPSVCWS